MGRIWRKAAIKVGTPVFSLLLMSAAVPATSLPLFELLPAETIGPASTTPILAAAALGSGSGLLVRHLVSEGRLALYRLDWPAKYHSASSGSIDPLWQITTALSLRELAITSNSAGALLAWVEGDEREERLHARRLSLAGKPAAAAVLLQSGPTRVREIQVGMTPEGDSLLAWINQLGDNSRQLQLRRLTRHDEQHQLLALAEADYTSQKLTLAVGAKNSLLVYVRSKHATNGKRVTNIQAQANDSTLPAPRHEIVARYLLGHGNSLANAPLRIAVSSELAHPQLLTRPDFFQVFWIDPARENGRTLRGRAFTRMNWHGPPRILRTDLRPVEPVPYRILPIDSNHWLLVWVQREGRGRAMVLEARVFHSTGNAISPPLLLASSAGTIVLHSLIPLQLAGSWLVLWDEEMNDLHHLRYRWFKKVSAL
ncbi:MAG: hypothetical protein HY692_00060 [Cyanobacteria bacterium NC_groundwater_1444_Ag_S-0.65um_54_12]|nr:hypothetical protein [Cyanobacteria bacterium NC_groundwater_1444_Ag_S-0.65um_54_12]